MSLPFLKKIELRIKNYESWKNEKNHNSRFILHNSKLGFTLIEFLSIFSALAILAIIILTSLNRQGLNLLKPKDVEANTYFYPKVLLITFNPIIESRGNQKLSSVLGWNNPDSLTQQYIEDMQKASGGTLNYSISQRLEVDDFPILQDGFDYTDQSYLNCASDNTKCHTNSYVDYAKLFTNYQICSRLNSTGASEVWFFSGPYNGFYEWNVKGPSLNLYEDNIPNCGKTVYVMGFNYERTVDMMLHDFGHRTEIILNWRVFNVWANTNNVWDKFDGQRWRYDYPIGDPQPAVQATGTHCGNVHFAPNSNTHYNVASLISVSSDCDDWLNYPNLTGKTTNLNCTAWGCNERDHNIWWLNHIPRNAGQTNGISNNWWRYVVDWDNSLAKVTAAILNDQPQMTCNNQGEVNVTFSWNRAEATDARAIAQWLDLSLSDNDFASQTFVSTSNPPYINSSSYQTGTGRIGPLTAGKTHYWRINTRFFGNQSSFWLPSATGTFKTPDCANTQTPSPTPSPTGNSCNTFSITSVKPNPVSTGEQVTVGVAAQTACFGKTAWILGTWDSKWYYCALNSQGFCSIQLTAPESPQTAKIWVTLDLNGNGLYDTANQKYDESSEYRWTTLTIVAQVTTPSPTPIPISTPTPSPSPAVSCLGPLKIGTLSSPVAPGGQVTTQIDGLANCNSLIVWAKINAQGQNWKNCTVLGSGCSIKDTAPNATGNYQILAIADLDQDGRWYEAGESDSRTLTVTGSTPSPTPTPTPSPNILPAKLTSLPQMSCNSQRNVETVFTWTKASGRAIDAQWLDLSLLNNNFAKGTFVGTNNPPYVSDSRYQTGTGRIGPLDDGKTHYWRLNTHFYGDDANTWYPSSTGVFTTPTCR